MINRITNAIYNKIYGRKDAEIVGLRKELRAASNELFDLRRLYDLVNVHIRPLGR